MQKESQLMRMPSDMKGPDKHNPCFECLESYDGWCSKFKKWGYAVKDRCTEPSQAKLLEKEIKAYAIQKGKNTRQSNKAKYGNKEKEVICLETGIKYRSTVIAAEKTGLDQSSISKCCNGVQKSTKNTTWKFTGVVI